MVAEAIPKLSGMKSSPAGVPFLLISFPFRLAFRVYCFTTGMERITMKYVEIEARK